MKKWIILFLIAVLCLGGCKKEEPKEEIADKKDPHAYLASLKDKPSKEDDVFIVANDGTYNEELLDAFLEKCEKKEDCDLVIARYTIEGDVIYELLGYDGERYTLYYDNSRDSYAGTLPDPLSRKYLYELDYITMEEMGDAQKPFRNHFAFLSDTFYEGEEEVKEAFERMREGEQIDLVDVFSDVRLCE